ncbi:hypothetical protein [Cellulophaga baltica]|uniref:hypothetical protein n=1 Tax=Cellulophaga baltica TaxID=76594 RepID=UPI002493F969|nr:hypothetical protein [Cellulophaga baltica]
MIKKIFYLLIGLFFIYGCTSDDSEEPIILKNVIIDVVYFEFIPDTGNDTFRLRYEINFTNPNSSDITGFYSITTTADSLTTTLLSTESTPCYEIDANSSCTLSFDAEDSFDLAKIESITLDSIIYTISQ